MAVQPWPRAGLVVLHCLRFVLVVRAARGAPDACDAASRYPGHSFARSLISALTTSSEDIGAFKHTCACRGHDGAPRTLRCEPARFGPAAASMAKPPRESRPARSAVTAAARRMELLRSAARIRLLSNASSVPVLGTGCDTTPVPTSAPGPWVALAVRGECAFTRKAIAAEISGAGALIVMDSGHGDGKGLMVMTDGGRLAGSQRDHVEFQGRMIPLSIPVVAVSHQDGLWLSRGRHACAIGYGGGWQAARAAAVVLNRLRRLASTKTPASGLGNTTRCGMASLAHRLGIALAQLSQIAPANRDLDAEARQQRLVQDAIMTLQQAAPTLMRCESNNNRSSAPGSAAALDMLHSLMLRRARSSAAAVAAAHGPVTYERLRANVTAAASFGAHVSHNDSLRLAFSDVVPRGAAARIAQLALARAQDEALGCDDEEGDMAGAWASWAGIPESATDITCGSGSNHSATLLPRGCILDEVASDVSASHISGTGMVLTTDDAWRWSWGWDKETLKRTKALPNNSTTAPGTSALMRRAMNVQGHARSNADTLAQKPITDAEAELRWLLGRVEHRIAQLLGVPRQHIEPPVFVQLRSGNSKCTLANQSAVNWAMARSDAHNDEVSNLAYARCHGDSHGGDDVPPSFSETSFQATVGGPRTATVHLYLGGGSADVCNDLSLSFLHPGVGNDALAAFVPAASGSAVMWANMECEPEFAANFPHGDDGGDVRDDRWRALRSSVYIDGQPKAGPCHVLRYRVRVRDTTLSASSWADKLRERRFLRSYDDMMKRAVTNRVARERLTPAVKNGTGTMAVCVATTTRRVAELVPAIQRLRSKGRQGDLRSMQIAAARAVQRLPLMRILVPSLLRTATTLLTTVKRLDLYVAFDAGDPLLDLPVGNRTVADVLRAALRNVYDHVRIRRSAVLRFDGGAHAPRKPGPAFNFVTASAFADGASAIVRVNDDTAFEPLPQDAAVLGDGPSSAHGAWPDAAMRALRSFPQPEPHLGVIGPHCGTGAADILTHDATHRTHLHVFRHYYPPQLADWWMDDWMSSVYRDATNSRTVRTPDGWSVAHHTSNQGTRYDVNRANRAALHLELRRGVAQVRRWRTRRDRQRAWQQRLRAATPKTRHLVAAVKDNDDRIVAAAGVASSECTSPHTSAVSPDSAPGLHAVYVLHHSSLARRRVTMHRHLRDRCMSPREPGKPEGAQFPNVEWVTEHVALRELGTLAEGVDRGTAPTEALYDPLRFLRANETLLKTPSDAASARVEDRTWQKAWRELRTFHPDQLTRGELSIALKHMAAWKRLASAQIADGDQEGTEPFAVVLEDDAVLCPLFRRKLAQYIEKLPRGWGLLSLGGTLGMHVNETEQLDGRLPNSSASVFLRKPVALTMLAARHHGIAKDDGTVDPAAAAAPAVAVHEISALNMFRSPDAYVLTRKAAKRLLATMIPLAFAIDAQLNVVLNTLALRHKVDKSAEEVRVFWAEPTVVVQASGDGYDLGSGADSGESLLQRQRRARQKRRGYRAARERLLRAALALSPRGDGRRGATSNDYRLHAWLAETLTGHEDALTHYDAAIRTVRAWNASDVWRRRLATLHHNAGAELQRRGASDGALRHFRAALIAAEPPSLISRVAIASTLRDMLPHLPRADRGSAREQAIHELRAVWQRLGPPRTHDGNDSRTGAAGIHGSASAQVDAGDAAGMLGALLLDSGETAEAIDVFRGAASLHPHRAVSWLNFGVAMLVHGDKTGARAALVRASLIDPTNEKVRRAREMLGESTREK